MKKFELTEEQKRLNNVEKIKKVFQYDDINIIIAEVVLNVDVFRKKEKQKINLIYVLAPNGGRIPLTVNHRETLKSIQQRTIQQLERFKISGCDVKNELTRQLN